MKTYFQCFFSLFSSENIDPQYGQMCLMLLSHFLHNFPGIITGVLLAFVVPLV